MSLNKNFPAVFALLMLSFAACESASDEIARRSAAAAQPADAGATPSGQAIFRKYCVACHGADGKLGLNGAKDLGQSPLTREERISIITKGKGLMTPFGELLSPNEIQAVAEYTLMLK